MQLTYISDTSFPLVPEGFMSDATVDIVLPDVPNGGMYSAVNHSCCILDQLALSDCVCADILIFNLLTNSEMVTYSFLVFELVFKGIQSLYTSNEIKLTAQ